jgi:predicted methyltransferase
MASLPAALPGNCGIHPKQWRNVMGKILIPFMALLLLGCNPSPPPEEPAPEEDEAEPAAADPAAGRLDDVLAGTSADVQARYKYRNPKATLEFFGIEPGMTVVEVLPLGDWYSKILVPYLGADGRLIGANYAQYMWPKFGFFDEEFMENMKTWTTDWPPTADAWKGDDGATVEAFEFGAMPESMLEQADAVLVIRALHNLARFEDDGGYLTVALNDIYRVLKPGGIVGVVQHEARPDMPDEWADGNAGYLKKQFVIDRMTDAGFELVDQSAINENPNDRPTTDDIVWRLPPGYQTSGDDAEKRAEMDKIGESNRMTLKFRKPE